VRDPHALAEAMRQIGEMDSAERRGLGQAGRAMVEENFGEGQVVDAYLDALAELRREGGV
jgi:glycosyltransferase involved in cell wall biosynthesis